jgi:hypothetical protein
MISDTDYAIVEKWEESGMLRGMSAEQMLRMSALLELQLISTEGHPDSQWRRISVPLIRRVLIDLPVEPTKWESQLEFYIFTGFNFTDAYKDTHLSISPLDAEEEATLEIAEKMHEQIEQLGEIQFYCWQLSDDGIVSMLYSPVEKKDYFMEALI